jgi:hypothetical protein
MHDVASRQYPRAEPLGWFDSVFLARSARLARYAVVKPARGLEPCGPERKATI